MSFFTSGFSGLLNNRRKKKASPPKDDGKKDKADTKKDEGKWELLTDAYGRAYWQHSVTGDWRFAFGGGLVSPVGTVNPSPVGYPGAVFTPSPVPVFAPPPPPPPPPPAEQKEEEKKEGKGWWETMHDDEGVRYWKHTVSKKTTYKDPFY